MEETISQNSGTVDIWDDSVITVSEDDLTINPIVLEPLEISFDIL